MNKTEVISETEQVLEAEGIECDSKVAKLPEETIKKILAEVRKRRSRNTQTENVEEEVKEQEEPIHAE